MNPLVQISEVSVKVCFVGRPRQSIHPRGGIAFEREERHPQAVDADVVEECGELSFFRCLAACRTLSSACVTRSRPCVRCVLCWRAFPLAPALGSTGSAAVGTALFVGFTATMAESDFL